MRVQAAFATGRSPLTAAVLRAHARALQHSALGPLTGALLARFAERPVAHPLEAPLLCAAAVHYEVLGANPGGPRDRLRSLYPSTGGAFAGSLGDEAALFRALQGLARLGAKDWRWFLEKGRLQPSEPGRALAWLLPARALQARRPLPLDLIELGAGAGLLLVGDQLLPDGAGLWVCRRLGLDRAPIDVGQGEVRRRLRACVFADQRAHLDRLDGAIEQLLLLRQTEGALALLQGDPVLHLPAALLRLREGIAGPRRLLIYNAAASAHLDDDGYDLLRTRVRDALRAWDGPALWLEIEPERGGRGKLLVVTAHRLRGEALEPMPLGRLPPHPDPEAGWERDASGWLRMLAE